MSEFDMFDPDIRAMVLRDHEPEEAWLHSTHGNQLVSVHCRTCWKEWPCPSITAAREFEAAADE